MHTLYIGSETITFYLKKKNHHHTEIYRLCTLMGTLLTGSDLRSDSNCLIKKCIVEGFTLCIDGAVKGMKLESQLPGEDF